MDADGFNEHGNGFDVERDALRSEELDEGHVEELTMTDADSMSKDTLLGASRLTSRLLTGSKGSVTNTISDNSLLGARRLESRLFEDRCDSTALPKAIQAFFGMWRA